MIADLANNIKQTTIMEKELTESKKENLLSEKANSIAQRANKLAHESNKIAKEGNQYSEKANSISREANNIARNANYIAHMDLIIAKRANYLSEKQINQDYDIAMMTLKQERRLSDASTELNIILNQKLTKSISAGLADVAAAIKDGLEYVGDIIGEAEYTFVINHTKMIAKNLHSMYNDYMLRNRDAHLSRKKVMKKMKKRFERHLDYLETLINNGKFDIDKFLHIAHLNTEEMLDKDCRWGKVRSRGFAINTMFMVLYQTIKRRNIRSEVVPPIFKDENIRFFKAFVNFNIRSSYEFETRCYENKVCFDSHFTKMPGELHCYHDANKIKSYCGAFN